LTIPVSVLILTKNEELNIGRCLESVAWSDDIVVLDSGSTDETVRIAASRGARILFRDFDNFAAQRNHAMSVANFKHDWVLHLDADEVATEALAHEIDQAIRDSTRDAFRIPSKLMFMGRWLRFSGMYPVYQVRLGRRDIFRFQQVGHGQREVTENLVIGTLREPYQHFSFSKGISDWIQRHDRYSTDEAEQELKQQRVGADVLGGCFSTDSTVRRRSLKLLTSGFPFRPTLRMFYMYILRLGFLDGRAGFAYCRLMSNYEYWIVLKRRELRQKQFN
jgi:glycosyltransferase involved in cell wall biosynthesis